MLTLRTLGRLTGSACLAIGVAQLAGGVRAEPGMDGDATVDSYVRFMGVVFAGYGLDWLSASAGAAPDLRRMRVLAGLMALGGLGRVATHVVVGRPHPFQDVLLGIELAAPVVVEAVARHER